jgi:hypothetical protein
VSVGSGSEVADSPSHFCHDLLEVGCDCGCGEAMVSV